MAFRSVLTFQVKEGQSAEFEAAYNEGLFLVRAGDVPGFLRADFMKHSEAPLRYIATADWENAEAFQEWQVRIPKVVPQDILMRLFGLLDDPKGGELFEILDTVLAS